MKTFNTHPYFLGPSAPIQNGSDFSRTGITINFASPPPGFDLIVQGSAPGGVSLMSVVRSGTTAFFSDFTLGVVYTFELFIVDSNNMRSASVFINNVIGIEHFFIGCSCV